MSVCVYISIYICDCSFYSSERVCVSVRASVCVCVCAELLCNNVYFAHDCVVSGYVRLATVVYRSREYLIGTGRRGAARCICARYKCMPQLKVNICFFFFICICSFHTHTHTQTRIPIAYNTQYTHTHSRSRTRISAILARSHSCAQQKRIHISRCVILLCIF